MTTFYPRRVRIVVTLIIKRSPVPRVFKFGAGGQFCVYLLWSAGIRSRKEDRLLFSFSTMSHGDDNLPVGFSNPVLNHFLKNIEQDDGKIALGSVQL